MQSATLLAVRKTWCASFSRRGRGLISLSSCARQVLVVERTGHAGRLEENRRLRLDKYGSSEMSTRIRGRGDTARRVVRRARMIERLARRHVPQDSSAPFSGGCRAKQANDSGGGGTRLSRSGGRCSGRSQARAPALAVQTNRSSGVSRDDRLGGSAVLATVAVGEESHGQRRLSMLAQIQSHVLLAFGHP